MARRKNLPEPIEQRCLICGMAFLTGGRGNRPKDQQFCSNECSRAARYRRGTEAQELTAADAAYIAGFLDGEGTIIAYMRGDVVSIRLALYNSSRPVLDWLRTVTGIGSVVGKDGRMAAHKRGWWWQANGDGAISVLRQVRPHMKVKTAQADLAIETQERLRQPVLKADRTWQAEWRLRMQELNRRGPVSAGG